MIIMEKRNGNTLKRIMAVFLSAALFVGMSQGAVPANVHAAKAVEQVSLPASGTDWAIDASGKLTIDSDAGMTDWASNSDNDAYDRIKSEYLKTAEIANGVTKIDAEAFWACRVLTQVTVPDSVTSIGEGAFQLCDSLKAFAVPKDIKRIEKNVFYNCSKIESISLPDGITSIGEYAFGACPYLEGLTIPDGVKEIGSGAFFSCRSLDELTIPDGVTVINEKVFYGCSGLKNISIPKNITSIGRMAFFECKSLMEIDIPDSVTSIGEEAFGRCETIKEIKIPDVITSIENGTFYGCSSLTKIEIPKDVTSIGESAFEDCSSLTGITIPNQITSIEESTFSGCSALKEIKIPDGVTKIGVCAFQECSSLEKIDIPVLVSDIQEGAFYGCSSLKKIVLPDGIEAIKGTTFAGCTSLTDITIPKSVTSIGAEAFEMCNNLTEFTIPNNIKSVGQMAFAMCNGLDKITIPSGVTDMGLYIFYGCISLSKVTMKGTTPPTLGEEAFTDCRFVTENFEGIEVPLNSLDTYKETWADWAEYIKASPVPADEVPPVGTIKIQDHSWNDFTDTVNFGLYFNESKSVTIEAMDTDSGVDKVYYYISDSGLSKTEVMALGEDVWTEGALFSINPDKKCVVYVKITDVAGNITYLSTDGLVFDGTAPVISGVETGGVFRVPQTVTVTDENLESVKVNDAKVILNENKFILGASHGQQIIVATDKAGNKSTVTVTIKTDKENIQDAKNIVEDVLVGCTVSNDTTKNDIQSLIDKALNDNGITIVNAAAGDLTKNLATTDAAGSMNISISLNCGSEADSITINKTIPATGNEPGNGSVDKQAVIDGKAPDTQISTSTDKLVQILLTEEEKKQISGGMDVKIVLDVKDGADGVSNDDKILVENALKGGQSQGFNSPQYIDISLFKVVGGIRSAISETKEALTITIKVPDSLKNIDGKNKRTFAVIRVHDGVAETLPDLDSDEDTITIATDRFSSYAIVHKDNSGDEKPTPPALEESAKPSETPDLSESANPTKTPDVGESANPTKTPDGSASANPTKTPNGNKTPTKKPNGNKNSASDKEKRLIALHSGLKAVQTEKGLQISWGRVNGADGYIVYVQYCGKGFSLKSRTQVKGAKKTKITVKNVNGKKLDSTKNIKMYVVAYKMKSGKKITLAKTLKFHIAGKDSLKYTNVKKIKAKKTSYILKKGKKITLRLEAVLDDKNKKQLSVKHTKDFRYISSNKKIATVTADGKVKAQNAGNCIIYVFAKNGCKQKIKIKVKK